MKTSSIHFPQTLKIARINLKVVDHCHPLEAVSLNIFLYRLIETILCIGAQLCTVLQELPVHSGTYSKFKIICKCLEQLQEWQKKRNQFTGIIYQRA